MLNHEEITRRINARRNVKSWVDARRDGILALGRHARAIGHLLLGCSDGNGARATQERASKMWVRGVQQLRQLDEPALLRLAVAMFPRFPDVFRAAWKLHERLPIQCGFARRPAARIRFLSVEPLLGPTRRLPLAGIHWVIVGGESDPGRALRTAHVSKRAWTPTPLRNAHPAVGRHPLRRAAVCVRQIRDRCTARNVPFFFKQWGGVNKKATGPLLDARRWREFPVVPTPLASTASH